MRPSDAPPTVRAAHADDLDEITRIFACAWPMSAPGCPADDADEYVASHTPRFWGTQLADDQYRLTVADLGGRPVGFSLLRPAEPAGVFELDRLFVDPAAHRRGVGRQLLTGATHAAADDGWNQMELWVIADNTPAKLLYADAGWHADGQQKTWRTIVWDRMVHDLL